MQNLIRSADGGHVPPPSESESRGVGGGAFLHLALRGCQNWHFYAYKTEREAGLGSRII